MSAIVPVLFEDVHYGKIVEQLCRKFEELGVDYDPQMVSSYLKPEWITTMVGDYDTAHDLVVYETVVIPSSGLPGIIAGRTNNPVVACQRRPSVMAQRYDTSSMETSEDCPVLFAFGPENSALAAANILSLSDPDLKTRLDEYRESRIDELGRIEGRDLLRLPKKKT